MIFPLYDKNPHRRFPWLTLLIIAANVAVMALQGIVPLFALLLIKRLVDTLTAALDAPGTPLSEPLFYAALVAVVVLVGALLQALSSLIGETQGQLLTDHLQGRIHAKSVTLDLAYSRAFAARLRDGYAGEALGAAVLFQATAVAPEAFHANLTFVQGHGAFTPDRRDPRSFGILDGALGTQPAGGVVLGYAVLPEGMDPRQPIDIYWNDRRISVVLAP